MMSAPIRRRVLLVAGFATAVLVTHFTLGVLALVQPYARERHAQVLYPYITRPQREDVLVIGSSRVAGGIDARLLGEATSELVGQQVELYKLGLGALRPFVLSEVLASLVARTPPRKLLVVAIEYRYFATPGWAPPGFPGRVVLPSPEAAALRASASAGRPKIRGEWEADILEADVWKLFRGLRTVWQAEWFLAATTRQRARIRHANGGEEWAPGARAYHENAWMRRAGGYTDPLDDMKPGMVWCWSPDDHPDQVGWRRSLQVLQQLRDSGACEVVFIRMPLAKGVEDEQLAGLQEVFAERVVADLASRGFVYFDLNRPPFPQDAESYFGFTHLNLRGCRRNTLALARELLAPWWRRTQILGAPALDRPRR